MIRTGRFVLWPVHMPKNYFESGNKRGGRQTCRGMGCSPVSAWDQQSAVYVCQKMGRGHPLPLCSVVCFIALSPAVCRGSWSLVNRWNHLLLSCRSSELRDMSQCGLCRWSRAGSCSASTPTSSLGLGRGLCRVLGSMIPLLVISSSTGRAWLAGVPREPCWITKRVRCSSKRLPAIR